MPKYAFVCRKCKNEIEVEAETGMDAEVPVCCGEDMKRIWMSSYQLKGEGWAARRNDEIPKRELPPPSEAQRRRRNL